VDYMDKPVLGIDLGGTKVYAAVVDGKGRITGHARNKTRAWRDEEKVFTTIVKTARRALAGAGLDQSAISAIGIGAPGPIDPGAGVIIDSANLPFRNFPLGERLSQEFGRPTIVENDVNAGIYGEFRAGAAQGATEVVGVFVGTGIGGGLILNGALYRGYGKNAGEVGHTIIEAASKARCGAGHRGCLEALASRTAITRDLRRAVKRGRRTSVSKFLRKETDVLGGKELGRAYEEGDQVVRKAMRRAAKFVGIGLGNFVNFLSPQLIVLGGGVIEAMDDEFLILVEKSMRKVAFEVSAKELKIVRAALGDDAGVIGAAMLARERHASGHQSMHAKS
jgi:glucokinase